MRVVVVGAGILGASVAYHLAKRGGIAVEIVDEGHQGKATLAGAGIVCPWSTGVEDPGFYALYDAAGSYYGPLVTAIEEEGERDFGYRRVGTLVLQDDPAVLEAAEKRIAARAQSSPEAGRIARLSGAEAKALFPPLRDYPGAIHIPGGARVDAALFAAAMLRIAERHGVVRRTGHVDLAIEGGRAVASEGGRRLEADAIIVTAGAWAMRILGPLGVSIPVAPQRGQITHLRLPGVETRHWPVLLPMSSHYLLAFDDSRVVVGATRETGSGFDYRVTAAGQAEVLNEALAVAPGLAGATLIETRIGFRPFTEAMRPLLGRAPGIDNLVIGNGLGASGITMGPYAGRLLAALALGETLDFDISPYSIA